MFDNVEILWKEVLCILSKKLGKQNLQNWIEPIQPALSENVLILSVPSKYHYDWIVAHFQDEINSAVEQLTDGSIKIKWRLPKTEAIYEESDMAQGYQENFVESIPGFQLNPKYTFENFVVGSSNRLAHAAALAVAEAPAKAYNPLFIYGGVGLGKTHLMQAIGHYVRKKRKNYKIVYTTTEQFSNDLINAIYRKNISSFQMKYRNVDVLLIDDIHFIAGKERTQEEFFHTFNALHEAHRQIVITSDRPPKEIPGIEERLCSRFEWGLIADIQPPELETRIAILKKKAFQMQIALSDEVVYYIAENIQSSIRELEGCLIRLAASVSISKREIDLEFVKQSLAGFLLNKKGRTIDLATIQKTVANYYNLSLAELLGKKRSKDVVQPRQIAMYLCRKYTNSSYPDIAKSFGKVDHTTVLHAYNKIEEMIKHDHNLRRIIEQIAEQFK